MVLDLAVLVSARRHPPLLCRRRAEAILLRVRAFATLFAVLTVSWIAVDAWMLGPPRSNQLALARIAAGALFTALALYAVPRPATPLRSRIALAALFAIPVAFFMTAQSVLVGARLQGGAAAIVTAYSFVPFLLACGIASFPLTLAETIVVALLPIGAQTWMLALQGRLPGIVAFDSYWLLSLIVAMSAFAAASQLRLMSELVSQAVRDPLTGCLRRESGRELLEMQLALAIRQRRPLAVLFADIDHFKAVNDGFGHDKGDEVLAATAAGLRAVLRESDALLRWGGEEFVVVLPSATSADAVRLIERLRAQGVGAAPDGKPVTLSIGIAEYVEDAMPDAGQLVELADQRMYLAKKAGRNRYVGGARAAAVPILAEA